MAVIMQPRCEPEPLGETPAAAEAAGPQAWPKPALQALLQPLRFADLAGFGEDDHLAAFTLFARHAAALLDGRQPLRLAVPVPEALRDLCRIALDTPARTPSEARQFFETHFLPYRVRVEAGAGFLTGYYEPVTAGSLTQTPIFRTPVLSRPDDLVSLAPGAQVPGLDPTLSAARRLPDGSLGAYPDRAEIEAGALADRARTIVFLADPVEVFFAQVQGSARITLPAGRSLRLTYAGRNGHPYTSIGRILVESGEIAADAIGLASVKAWIRAHGQKPGQAGHALMLRNKSYVFFSASQDVSFDEGPIGGAGLSLAALRSIAIDRNIWPYGLPFWLSAELPWQGAEPTVFRRLMIGGDTGSAIVGPARADLFFGSGSEAGARAGNIRHNCDFIVLLPCAARPGSRPQ
jgi:membrane-bound lytic murein transglycosylase A